MGFTSFDDFGWALISGARLITSDYWEGLYHLVRDTTGPVYVIYFILMLTTSLSLLALFPSVFFLTVFELRSKKEDNVENIQKGVQINPVVINNGSTNIQVMDVDCDERLCIEGQKENVADNATTESTFTSRQLMTKYPKCENTKCISVFCMWNCCQGARNKVHSIIFDPFVELLITVAVIVKVIALSMDHDDVPLIYEYIASYTNLVFTFIILIEAILKIFALSPGNYFRNNWNILDFILVVSLAFSFTVQLDDPYEQVGGVFHALTILKLGRLWPTLYTLMEVFKKAESVLWSFSFLICIVMLIFAGIGMHTFGWYYEFHPDYVSRWNFTDLFHSWMSVFRTYCGEWIELAWDCMKVYGLSAFPFFLISYIIGHCILAYIFLAFLINCGSSAVPKRHLIDDSKIMFAAVERFSNFGRWLRKHIPCKKVHPNTTEGNFGAEQQKTNETGHTLMENQDEEDIDVDIIQILQQQSRSENAPPRCCPDPIYSSSICWNNHSEFSQKVRMICYNVIQKLLFERAIHVLIIFFSILLASEDSNLGLHPSLQSAVNGLHIFFGCLFFLEMLIRWTGNGIKLYFCDFWCWIDFAVIISFITELILYKNGITVHPFVRAVRVIRIFRLIRGLFLFKSSRTVLNTLGQSLPGLINFLIMGSCYWLIFIVAFTQLYLGMFYECVDERGQRLNSSYVPTYEDCLENNLTWKLKDMHFNDLFESFFSLLHIASLRGWKDVGHSIADSRSFEMQPEEEVNIYGMLGIVLFIVFGSLLMYSQLIAVILDGYNRQKYMVDSSAENLNRGEKLYYHLKNKLLMQNNQLITFPEPKFGHQARIYNFVFNEKFDFAVTCLISLSLILLALVSADMNEKPVYSKVFTSLYAIFLMIFTVECILKLIAVRLYYFKSGWNIADLLAVLLGIIDISLDHPLISFSVLPPLLLRVSWIPRRLKFLSTCKQTFKIALPRLLTIFFILFLVIFVYSIFGMALFPPMKKDGFHSFGSSLEFVFQLAFALSQGDLLSNRTSVTSLYLVSLAVITDVFLLAVLFVFIMVSYQEANEKVEDSLTREDSSQFYVAWQKYDPFGTGYIKNTDLQPLVNSLPKPLQITNLSKYKIGVMDIPLCKDDKVHHTDVVDALIRNYLSEKGFVIRLDVIIEMHFPPNDQRYDPVSSTLWRQRELKSANVIKKWWNSVKRKPLRGDE